MVAQRVDPRPLYSKRPFELGPSDVGREVILDPSRGCAMCGHVIQVAKVVRLSDGQYEYLCHGCAVRFG